MPVSMICPRDYVLRSRAGHTVRFVAGEPTQVPDDMVADALAMNIVPNERTDREEPAFGLVSTAITGTLRDSLIFGAIADMVQRNNHEEFDGGGVPKVEFINRATGLTLSSTERGKYWNRYRELLASNSALPTHPNTELVLELQGLTSRKQLEEFAKDASIDISKYKGKALKEVKTELLGYVINQRPNIALKSEYATTDDGPAQNLSLNQPRAGKSAGLTED